MADHILKLVDILKRIPDLQYSNQEPNDHPWAIEQLETATLSMPLRSDHVAFGRYNHYSPNSILMDQLSQEELQVKPQAPSYNYKNPPRGSIVVWLHI